MKKLRKNMTLLCSLLFVGQVCQASFVTRLSGFSLLTSAVLIKGAYDYFDYKEDSMGDLIDAQIFSNSLKWYENLAVKYPEAHLDQKKFKSGFTWAADVNHKVIMASFEDLIAIERAPENDQEMQSKIEKMAGFEGVVLHEAGHIEHNHYIKALCVAAGILIPLEISYQAYMKKIPQTPSAKKFSSSLWNLTKSMPRRITLFSTMLTVSSLVQLYNARQREREADAFVCKHADLPALRGYAQFLQKDISLTAANISNEIHGRDQRLVELLSTHPSSASRLVAVQKEIARRELAKVK